MDPYPMDALTCLERRGLVEAVSDPSLKAHFAEGPIRFYIGFDPSARSLQLGNLFAVATTRRLQLMGHSPVILVGGATGMIGDPSGRGDERNLLDADTLGANVAAVRAQLERFVDFSGPAAAQMVNNYDWLGHFPLVEWLRDVGRRFRVAEMLAKEAVKRRLESADGISYTEFTYQMLQAYDFLHLFRALGVTLQLGGSDQWGNIAAGIDLVRKELGKAAYGLCVPLVTDAQGNKFGKSLGGAVYLDASMTSPYRMYQYLLNADDSLVGRYLRYFTFLEDDALDALDADTRDRPGQRLAQRALADAVVEWVHGKDGLAAAHRATRLFFGEAVDNATADDFAQAFADAPSATLPRAALEAGLNVVDLLAATPLWKGKNDVRRSIQQKGAYLDHVAVDSPDRALKPGDLGPAGAFIARKGKKSCALVRFS